MGILDRFFGKRTPDTSSSPLIANELTDGAISLQLLFPGKLSLEPAALTRSLRTFDPAMAKASCELDAALAASGTPVGLVGWGKHVIRVVGFDQPMPAEAVETCVQPSHYGPELKARARDHRSHVLLYYAGTESDPLEQYVALAATAAVLSQHGAIVVLNEIAHTSFPAEPLSKGQDKLASLRTIPILALYAGFVKYDVEGVSGTWMRTYGNHVLGVPDFAHLARGHHEGQATHDMMCALISYLRSSGAKFALGDTMELGPDLILRVRAPTEDEYFLESDGEMLVLEKISRADLKPR